ncbi:hypothetical protein [Pasteuria penetrans]|uniref:hypothetical protein n=1 Tax=Pasteuria penetrans TaxID=86005 RepID=UPI000FA72572|nr:hypothetical protein [Pasteuria penetrans]
MSGLGKGRVVPLSGGNRRDISKSKPFDNASKILVHVQTDVGKLHRDQPGESIYVPPR